LYNLAVTKIPATVARQKWAQTLDAARREPVTITEYGRETVMLLDIETAHRALEALEDAEDGAAAVEVETALARGDGTVPLEDVARELGLTLD
jgi:prevent-host-death family protein